MAKPIILAVDDDAEVLHAVAHDVRQGFGEHFRVIRADSGSRALDVLRQLKLAGESVALMLVDQRMPEMSGVEFLSLAKELFPDAKRVLLTAYADTEAAITAINEVQLDYYLIKPWDPPEQRLYPVLDDLLDDWLAAHHPPFEGVRVIGHRWSAESHAIRDFLARNQVPYQWFDLANGPHAAELLALIGEDAPSPAVLFPDGRVLQEPSVEQVAETLGLRGHAEIPLYDLLIVGGGPAGLAAAVYGASEGLRTVLVEREATGGQAGMSSRIENYLGFPSGLSGADLARRATTQAKRFGVELLLTQEVSALRTTPGSLGVSLSDGTELGAHSIVLATGVTYIRLEAPGLDGLVGRGVYYGAGLSEVSSTAGEDVFVAGGANSAGQAVMHLSTVARSVTMLVRGASLAAGMSHYLVEQIERTPNITVLVGASIVGAVGEDHLEQLVIRDSATGESHTEPTSALFVFIGARPRTEWLTGVIGRDERGFVLTGPDVAAHDGRVWPLDRDPFLLETNVPGVFAVGDVRHGSAKRVATAVGEGASAVLTVWQYRASAGL
ncbi:MAG: FAD-dependent oxidoreductase [Micropruina sp.]|nr:FAD-dependent oxidoreductase [Micropruina sp.]